MCVHTYRPYTLFFFFLNAHVCVLFHASVSVFLCPRQCTPTGIQRVDHHRRYFIDIVKISRFFSEWRAFSDISPVIPNPRFRATLTNANAARRCCTIAWWCLWCKMVLSLWWSPVRPTRTLTRWWCSRSSGWLLGFWSVPCHWTQEFFLAKKSSWSSLRVPFGESMSCF